MLKTPLKTNDDYTIYDKKDRRIFIPELIEGVNALAAANEKLAKDYEAAQKVSHNVRDVNTKFQAHEEKLAARIGKLRMINEKLAARVAELEAQVQWLAN